MHAAFFFYTILFKVKGHQKFVSKVSLFYVTFLTVDVVVKKWFMNNKARHIFMAAFASQVRDTVVWGKKKDKRKKENPICMLCLVILVQFYCLVKGSREESQKGKEKKGVRVDNK